MKRYNSRYKRLLQSENFVVLLLPLPPLLLLSNLRDASQKRAPIIAVVRLVRNHAVNPPDLPRG
jgi:hypothetical protein